MNAASQGLSLNECHIKAQSRCHYDAIVIGSGIGGLTVAACLAKANKKVLVLEQHFTAGGLTHTFARKGYEWGVGVHYIGEVHKEHSLLRKIFDFISNEKLEWNKITDPYDKILLGDEVYDFVAGRKQFLAQMNEYFPGEKSSLEKYLNLLELVSQKAFWYFSPQALPEWIARIVSPTFSKPFLYYSTKTTQRVMSEITSNSKMIKVLTGQWGNYGLPPHESSFAMHALVAKHYLDGASFPVGGPKSLFETIAATIQTAGGEVITRANVAKIIIKEETAVGVTLQDGRQFLAPHIISGAGVHNTFQKLIDRGITSRLKMAKNIASIQPSIAHLCLYVGLKGNAREIGLEPSNLWIISERERNDKIAMLEDILGIKIPVVFISFPSLKDPLWEKNDPQKSTVEMVVPVPYEPFAKWDHTVWQKRGKDYGELKKNLISVLFDLLEQYVPRVKRYLDCFELSTPLSSAYFLQNDQGEIYGLRHDPARFSQTFLRTHTGISHLHLVGQDTVTCGIAGACLSGALTALRILGPVGGRDIAKILLGDTILH